MSDKYVEEQSIDEQTDIGMGDLKLITACCCTASGLYCPSFKQCFGGHSKGEVMCCGIEALFCKLLDTEKSEDGECCVLVEQKIVCKKPKTVSDINASLLIAYFFFSLTCIIKRKGGRDFFFRDSF